MLRICIILTSILIIGFSVIPEIQTSNAQSEQITVKHWFISSYETGCSYGNEKALEFYQTLTPQYLSKYDIHGVQSAGECVRLIDVQNNLNQFVNTANTYDLPIVILDGFSGLDYALTTDALGHYQFQGNDRIIVFASLSPFIESDTGAWILGHELAHFALHYKNYPTSIYASWVHTIESNARDCVGDDLSLNYCPELWTTVKAPSGKLIKMMAVYTEESPSISTSPPSTSTTTLTKFLLGPFVNPLFAKQGEEITVSGVAMFCDSSKDIVSLSFFDSSNKIIFTDSLSLGNNCGFESIYELDTNVNTGQWRVEANYANDVKDWVFTVSSSLGTIQPKPTPPKISDFSPQTKKTFDIKPMLTNGFIEDYKIDPFVSSIILDVKTENFKSGEMQLVLPRGLIDSKFGSSDDVFFVLIDGEETGYDQVSSNSAERIIRFSVPSGANNVEIIGTQVATNAQVIPEFQEIAIMVLVTGIIAVISISKKLQIKTKTKQVLH